MKKIHEIIRMHEVCKLSIRQISKAVDVSRIKVSETIEAIDKAGLCYSEIKEKSDSDLIGILTPQKKVESKAEVLQKSFPEYVKELKKTGVTRQLLWQEYLQEHPDGLKYTQFCFHFDRWSREEKLFMHIDHKAGDKMFIDYAGKKMEITDKETGEKKALEIFVAILPASQLTYVEASVSQEQEQFMRSTERAIRYYGGVPSAIVPDNLKSGVIKANIYEPQINPLFADFAEYYRTAVVPARSRKPQDKAHVLCSGYYNPQDSDKPRAERINHGFAA